MQPQQWFIEQRLVSVVQMQLQHEVLRELASAVSMVDYQPPLKKTVQQVQYKNKEINNKLYFSSLTPRKPNRLLNFSVDLNKSSLPTRRALRVWRINASLLLTSLLRCIGILHRILAFLYPFAFPHSNVTRLSVRTTKDIYYYKKKWHK